MFTNWGLDNGQALRNSNLLFSQSFAAASEVLQKLETNRESPLFGHSLEGIFLLTPTNLGNMERAGITTVSQLLREAQNGNISREINEDILREVQPNTSVKLRHLVSGVQIHRTFTDCLLSADFDNPYSSAVYWNCNSPK